MRFNIEMDNLCAQAVQKKRRKNGYQICALKGATIHTSDLQIYNQEDEILTRLKVKPLKA